jgi:hypothetical protein
MLYINSKDRFNEMTSDYQVRNIIKEEYANYLKEAAEKKDESEKSK